MATQRKADELAQLAADLPTEAQPFVDPATLVEEKPAETGQTWEAGGTVDVLLTKPAAIVWVVDGDQHRVDAAAGDRVKVSKADADRLKALDATA